MVHGHRQLVPCDLFACEQKAQPKRSGKGVVSSHATSETCTHNCQRRNDRALCEDCLRKKEEGAGHGKSVRLESPGLHARNNGRDNGLQHRKVKLIL